MYTYQIRGGGFDKNFIVVDCVRTDGSLDRYYLRNRGGLGKKYYNIFKRAWQSAQKHDFYVLIQSLKKDGAQIDTIDLKGSLGINEYISELEYQHQ